MKCLNYLKKNFENNQIIFTDTSNKIDIHKKKYLAKLKNNDINNFNSIKESYSHVSIINNPNNDMWYIYKIDNEYKINKDNYGEPKLPCIFINNYEILLLSKEMFDNRIDFEIKHDKKNTDWIIKEITCCPITLDIVKKNNQTLIKEITHYINGKIEKYDNIEERIPFCKSDNKTLEIFL